MSVIPLPKNHGLCSVYEKPADVLPWRYWRFKFCHMSALSICTDEPDTITVLAPRSLPFADAIEWARQRVPEGYVSVGAVRSA